jgi:hypothetical protein
MFKITGRIILILLAASLVAGALYFLVNGTGGQPGLLSSLDYRGGFRGANRQASVGTLLLQGLLNPGFRPDFGDSGFRSRFSVVRAFSGVISDLIIVTLITVVVVLLHGAFKKGLRRPPEKSA